MARKSRMKRLVIGLVVVIVAALVAVGLYAMAPKATPEPPKTEVSLTQTPDFNACKVISVDTIKKTSHADVITDISEGLRTGIHAPNGTIADSCGYAFATQKAKNNTFTVEVYSYLPTVNGDNKESVGSDWSEVSGSQPTAYFGSEQSSDFVMYKLRAIPGGKNVMFELKQPNGTAALDEADALEFLAGIAAKANYDVINPITAE